MSKRKFPIALCPSGMRMPKYTLKIFSDFTTIYEGNHMERFTSSNTPW